MSELIDHESDRMNRLITFAGKLIRGEGGKSLVDEYRPWTGTVTPEETMAVFDGLLQQDFTFEQVKQCTGKIMNVFFRSLQGFRWDKPGRGHFLFHLEAENRHARRIIEDLKSAVKKFDVNGPPVTGEVLVSLRALISGMKQYDLHYVKKENILFPYLERAVSQHRCLRLMWSFHDDYRRYIRILETMATGDRLDGRLFIRELGHLLFIMLPVMFREEQVVFPVALRMLPGLAWDEMLHQAAEVGWCYIPDPEIRVNAGYESESRLDRINLGTGRLSADQLLLLFNHLPVDLTYVDEQDSVCFYSTPAHRIFPRSPAVIGRKVQNCHPPESVHVVNRILDEFRSGKRDVASFHLPVKGKMIQIRYFALRDTDGRYRGTLEVSQDVSQITGLTGEQRLLDWDEGTKNDR